MPRFVQLSDLHVHGKKKLENINCEKIIRFITRKYGGPAADKPVDLITGDIVDDGKARQYRSAVKRLKPLVDEGFTVLPAPGNHGYGPCGNFYEEESQADFLNFMLAELIGYTPAQAPGARMEDLFPMVTPIKDAVFSGLEMDDAQKMLRILASGKTTKPNPNHQFQFREVQIDPHSSAVTMITFSGE